MGRWSAHHRKIAIFGWLAFVLAAFAIGTFVVGAKQATSASGPGESGRMEKILEAGFKQPAGETVLVQSQTLTTEDPAFQKAINDVVANVSKAAGRVQRPVSARGGERRADLRRRPLGPGRFPDPR